MPLRGLLRLTESNRDAALNEHMATVIQFGTQKLAADVPAFVEFCKCKGVEHPITSMSFGLRLSDRVLHKKQNNRTRSSHVFRAGAESDRLEALTQPKDLAGCEGGAS